MAATLIQALNTLSQEPLSSPLLLTFAHSGLAKLKAAHASPLHGNCQRLSLVLRAKAYAGVWWGGGGIQVG